MSSFGNPNVLDLKKNYVEQRKNIKHEKNYPEVCWDKRQACTRRRKNISDRT